jgi:hypothetical protein
MWLSISEITDEYPYLGLFFEEIARNNRRGAINHHVTPQQNYGFVFNLMSKFKEWFRNR